jgi:hypothetical protein
MLGYWKGSSYCKQMQQRKFSSAPTKIGAPNVFSTSSVMTFLNRGHRRFSTTMSQISVSDLEKLKPIQSM